MKAMKNDLSKLQNTEYMKAALFEFLQTFQIFVEVPRLNRSVKCFTLANFAEFLDLDIPTGHPSHFPLYYKFTLPAFLKSQGYRMFEKNAGTTRSKYYTRDSDVVAEVNVRTRKVPLSIAKVEMAVGTKLVHLRTDTKFVLSNISTDIAGKKTYELRRRGLKKGQKASTTRVALSDLLSKFKVDLEVVDNKIEQNLGLGKKTILAAISKAALKGDSKTVDALASVLAGMS